MGEDILARFRALFEWMEGWLRECDPDGKVPLGVLPSIMGREQRLDRLWEKGAEGEVARLRAASLRAAAELRGVADAYDSQQDRLAETEEALARAEAKNVAFAEAILAERGTWEDRARVSRLRDAAKAVLQMLDDSDFDNLLDCEEHKAKIDALRVVLAEAN